MNQETSRKFELDNDLFASQGQRFANYILDYICQIVLMFGSVFVLAIIATVNGNEKFVARIGAMNQLEQYALGAVIVLVYYNISEIFFSRTIGKLATNTIVVDRNGNKPDSNEILVRSLCRLIPLEAFSFLGAPDKGWHDRISKTYVVKKSLLEEKKKAFNSLDQIGKNDY